MCSFLSTMFLGVEIGLAISIGLALMIVIYESAFPHTALLGRVGRTTIYRNVKQFPDSQVRWWGVHIKSSGVAQLGIEAGGACGNARLRVVSWCFARCEGIELVWCLCNSRTVLLPSAPACPLRQVIPGIAACRVDAPMYFASEWQRHAAC